MTTILRVLVVDSIVFTCIHACIVTKTTQEYIAGHCSHHNQSIPGITPLNQSNQITRPFVPACTITPSAHANHFKPQAHANLFNIQHKDLWGLGTSPVKINILQDYLARYPDGDTAMLLLSGFSTCFYLNYTGLRLPLLRKNMKSADVHSSELLAIINKEIHLGCMAGPFNNPPKKDGGWRLFTNLSAPIGNSVNDFINPALCSVSYASFDDAITMISSLGNANVKWTCQAFFVYCPFILRFLSTGYVYTR